METVYLSIGLIVKKLPDYYCLDVAYRWIFCLSSRADYVTAQITDMTVVSKDALFGIFK